MMQLQYGIDDHKFYQDYKNTLLMLIFGPQDVFSDKCFQKGQCLWAIDKQDRCLTFLVYLEHLHNMSGIKLINENFIKKHYLNLKRKI